MARTTTAYYMYTKCLKNIFYCVVNLFLLAGGGGKFPDWALALSISSFSLPDFCYFLCKIIYLRF